VGSAAWLLVGHRTPNPETGHDTTSRMASIGILPFVNRGDSTDEYLSDGIADDLIDRMAAIPGLKVAARTSVFSYKGKPKPLRDVANELNVDALLEGSVSRTPDSIRITARLIDAGSEVQIWSESYGGTPSDLVKIENDLLQASLQAMGQEAPDQLVMTSGGAYDLYLKGRYYYEKYETDDVRRALQYFSDAVDRDPSFALGYAGLSDAYYQLSTRWIPADQAMPRALAAAEQALKLDPNLSQGYIALSRVQAYWQFDWEAAERSLQRALALKPNLASARESYGLLLVFRGQPDSALTQLRLAQEYDPLSQAIAFEATWPFLFGGKLGQAVDAYDQYARTFHANVDASIGEIYALQGDHANAIRMIEGYRKSHANMNARYEAVLARSYQTVGRTREAQEILDMLLRRSRERDFGNSYMLAMLYSGIGKPDQALDWLERCDSVRNENIILIKVDPEFASIRSEPRFQAILKRIGLAN
jgi:TolB-like protein/Tfp pilus assembly protein PilF